MFTSYPQYPPNTQYPQNPLGALSVERAGPWDLQRRQAVGVVRMEGVVRSVRFVRVLSDVHEQLWDLGRGDGARGGHGGQTHPACMRLLKGYNRLLSVTVGYSPN